MPDNSYTEEEVAKILRRAAELESENMNSAGLADGQSKLSLEELENIARESGLDPRNIRTAAMELAPGAQRAQTKTDESEVNAEVWVDGTLTDELSDLVISDLNHRFNTTHERESWRDNILNDGKSGSDGKSVVNRTGKTLEWKKINESGSVELRVLIQPRADQVRIRVSRKKDRKEGFKSSSIYPFLPYIAGIALFFSLPFSLWLNFIAGLLGFTLTRLFLVLLSDKLTVRQNRSGRDTAGIPDSKDRTEILKKEAAGLAHELSLLLADGGPSDKAAGPRTIGLPDRTGPQKETGGTDSGKIRKRE